MMNLGILRLRFTVVRYETPAGRQAPCDWAKFGDTEAPDGTVEPLWLFAYTLDVSLDFGSPSACHRSTPQDFSAEERPAHPGSNRT